MLFLGGFNKRMLCIKKRTSDSPRIEEIESEAFSNFSREFFPVGYYSCTESGLVDCLVDNEAPTNIKIWVYSNDRSKFNFSNETLNHPIVIRKGNEIWYASFRNFNYVYNDAIHERSRFFSTDLSKIFFEPVMFNFRIDIKLHDTIGTTLIKHPWFFFRDLMEPARISEPREGARKAINISGKYTLFNHLPVYFYLRYIGGEYYCKEFTDEDPMLSRKKNIRGYEISKYSTKTMVLRSKVFKDELIVIGGYHNPGRYKTLMYQMANEAIKNKEDRLEFYKEMKSFKLRTFTCRYKYSDLSEKSILDAKKALYDSYKRDINIKITEFMERRNKKRRKSN